MSNLRRLFCVQKWFFLKSTKKAYKNINKNSTQKHLKSYTKSGYFDDVPLAELVYYRSAETVVVTSTLN